MVAKTVAVHVIVKVWEAGDVGYDFVLLYVYEWMKLWLREHLYEMGEGNVLIADIIGRGVLQTTWIYYTIYRILFHYITESRLFCMRIINVLCQIYMQI
jgi:hypothetical protein